MLFHKCIFFSVCSLLLLSTTALSVSSHENGMRCHVTCLYICTFQPEMWLQQVNAVIYTTVCDNTVCDDRVANYCSYLLPLEITGPSWRPETMSLAHFPLANDTRECHIFTCFFNYLHTLWIILSLHLLLSIK